MTRSATLGLLGFLGLFGLLGAGIGGVVGYRIAREQEPAPIVAGEPPAARRARLDAESLERELRRVQLADVATSEDPLVVDTFPVTFRDEISIERDHEPGADPADLVPMRERIAELEAEVARLTEIVRTGDERKQRIKRLIAKEPLRHGELYLELFERAMDGEAIALDPTPMLPLLLRLVDETGVAAAPIEDEARRVKPEPRIEDTWVTLRTWTDEIHDDPERAPVTFDDQLELSSTIRLPHDAEEWQGDDLELSIELSFGTGSDSGYSFFLQLSGPSSYGGQDSCVRLEWMPGRTLVERAPVRGGEESRALALGEFDALRRETELLLARLRSRLR